MFFFVKSASTRAVNSMEQKTRFFCENHGQEFHLSLKAICHVNTCSGGGETTVCICVNLCISGFAKIYR
jgi:hypothetical protein